MIKIAIPELVLALASIMLLQAHQPLQAIPQAMAAQQETNSSARKSLVLLPHHPPIATSLQGRHMHTCISEPRENLAFQDLLEESINTNLEAATPLPADEVQEYIISDQATPTASCRQETSYVMSTSTLVMASYQPLFHLKSFESKLQPQETNSSTSSALVLMPNRPLNYARFIMNNCIKESTN